MIAYLRLLRRRWWIVVLGILVGVSGAIGGTAHQHKRYRTSAQVLVSGSSNISAADEITRRTLASQRAVSFAQIATTDPVITAAEQKADQLVPGLSAETAGLAISAT